MRFLDGQQRPRRIIWRMNHESVFLTFDDGPDTLTPRLLDLLEDLVIKASFFLIGEKVEHRQQLTRRIQDSGHSIGNHSYDHPSFLWKSPLAVRAQIEKTDDIIQQATGTRPAYFRPPYGRFGLNVLRVLKQSNHQMVLWSGSARDYRPKATPASIQQDLLRTANPGNIILLHDGHRNSPLTLKALERPLTKLKNAGTLFSVLPTAGKKDTCFST